MITAPVLHLIWMWLYQEVDHGYFLTYLIVLYMLVPGMRPASLDRMMFERIWDQLNLTKIAGTEQECPFSWARSPDKLLQQETYLILAITFVLLRLIYVLLPTVRVCLERAWRGWMWSTSLMRLWEHPKLRFEHPVQVLNRRPPSKRINLQEGAMNAKAWASKSLATVTIGEASSSRASFGGWKICEIGAPFYLSLWIGELTGAHDVNWDLVVKLCWVIDFEEGVEKRSSCEFGRGFMWELYSWGGGAWAV